jgi:two-component system nitrogen regulation response regulator NtrX
MISDVLVVDDEADIRELVAAILQDDGYAVRTAHNAEAALAAIRARKPALLILDIWMSGGGLDGLELLDRVKSLDPDLPVVMISGHGNIETAVSSIKRGAYDFIEKPFKSDRLMLVVRRALEAANLRRENRQLRTQAIVPDGLVGGSAATQQLRSMIARVAPANSRVLISGPPGSGKETAARLIHAASPRARNEFVAISAAGMTPERMDRELFGEESGAGRPGHIGVFERAHGGTLYVDDVADMPRESQSRILRVLVEQRFRRVGGDTDVQVDVRVVSSTSRDLAAEIAAGRLREDLFHRLTRRTLAPDAYATLQVQGWPGNVRQLKNVVERVLILAAGEVGQPITADMLPVEASGSASGGGVGGERTIAMPLREARELFEREYLDAQIMRFGGNISRTAAFIGMERSALHRKLKSLGFGGARLVEEAGD